MVEHIEDPQLGKGPNLGGDEMMEIRGSFRFENGEKKAGSNTEEGSPTLADWGM